MIKHGYAPYLECSSVGDRRFSAFFARIKKRDNKSVEETYQAAKVFENGKTGLTWREAKGKKAVNQEQVSLLYDLLWKEYLEENPDLLKVLKEASGLSDRFGQPGHCCQATSLWKLSHE